MARQYACLLLFGNMLAKQVFFEMNTIPKDADYIVIILTSTTLLPPQKTTNLPLALK